MKLIHSAGILASLLLLTRPSICQEAGSGFVMPVMVSGASRFSGSAGDGYAPSGGFRVFLSPSLQLGSHWFAYSVFGAQSQNYWDYKTGLDVGRAVSTVLLQGYIGYKTQFKSATVLMKGGRLMPAFGHYPLEYDDAKTPLIEPPSLYSVNLLLRPDQIPCNLRNILYQAYDNPIKFRCGGSSAERYGIVPETLYGVPGMEAQVSWGRIDGRLQVTNSSPANPQSLLSHSQFLEWEAGAGYSSPGGLHVGASWFRGPYLSRVVEPFLPTGAAITDFDSSGAGVDAQWSGGPWSAEGEWQHLHFAVPRFIQSPALDGGYIQIKRILSPRFFVAGRSNWQMPGGATDSSGAHASQIDAHQNIEEIVVGYRFNRLQLLKTGFAFSERRAWTAGHATWAGEQHYGFELQLVTSFAGISKGFH